MVTFGCLNLVEDVYPALANDTNAMDLIFCRNVLMYFSQEQLHKVVANLRRSLVPDGGMVVSATEASREVFGDFVPAGIPGVMLYRNEAPTASPASVALPARIPASPPLPAIRLQAPPVALADHPADARRLANEGKLSEALAACDRALAADRLVAAHHYLRGVILQEQNALDEASTALKRALYLDPDFVIAHFALGHLMLRLGRSGEAVRCFANARLLVRTCAPDAVLPESDGITAGRLLAILTATEEAIA